MKTVAYISSYQSGEDLVWRIAQDAVHEVGAVLTRMQDFLAGEFSSVDLSRNLLWTFLSEADVVLAHTTFFDARLWFELGVAVGLRKRLVVIATDRSVVPFDLSDSVVSYETGPDGDERLRFKLEQLLREHLKRRPGSFASASPRYQWRSSGQLPSFDFRSGRGPMATGFARRFEQWITEVFRSVSDWEVITGKGSDQGYDVVVWNNLLDTDLATLGNPIVVEAKAGKMLTKATIDQLIARAARQRLKGFILVTTATASASVRKHVADRAGASGLSVVVLDREDLSSLGAAKDLVASIKSRLLEIRRSTGG